MINTPMIRKPVVACVYATYSVIPLDLITGFFGRY